MATTTGTAGNDSWSLNGSYTGTLDGLGGTDTLSLGTLKRSGFTLTQNSDGSIMVDTISGASGSSASHILLKNMEILKYNSGTSSIDLTTYFGGSVNHAPTVASQIADQVVTSGNPLNFAVPSTSFTDSDSGDVLTFKAVLASGKALPSWLKFTAATETFSGTPTNSDTGQIDITVTATDKSNASVSDTFAITVNSSSVAIPPTVTAFSPSGDSTDVSTSAHIVATFDEAIQKGTGNIVLKTSAGKTVETYSVAKSAAVSVSGDVLTINPTKSLSYGTSYTLVMDSGTVTSTSGAKYAGENNYSFTTTDTLITSASHYTLGSKDPSKLTYSGSADFVGTGNSAANLITGGPGNDTLDGGGGSDTLTGGGGNDIFVFDTKLNATSNVDTITDFTSGTDAINLSKKIFTAYKTAGADLNNDFVSSASPVAVDKTDHFLYDTTTGNLYYDADGSGKGAAVLFASLTGQPTLVATDLHML